MNRKLTDNQKIEICEKYKNKNFNCAELGREYKVSKESINYILRVRGITILNNRSKLNRKYTLNENYFDKIDTEEKSYFLGLLYADGYNHEKNSCISLQLQDRDKKILEKFNIEINSNRPLSIIRNSVKNPMWKDAYKLTINSKHMSQRLSEIGCFQAKSLTLKFPSHDIIPDNLINHFLRGYMDGDGCIYYKLKIGKRNGKCFRTKISLVSTNDFCQSTKLIIEQKLSINCHVQNKSKNNITKDFVITGDRNSVIFLNWIYKDSTTYLNRKHKSYEKLKSLINFL